MPSQEALHEFIRWLDLVCSEEPLDSLPRQILTRGVIAAGKELIEKRAYLSNHPVAKTLQAAEAYCLAPTEATSDRYFRAATNSYPFGTGEGCYAVKELGYAGCEPGSGCTSGAGTLDQIAYEVGAAEVMRLIAKEIVPWLKGESESSAEFGSSD
ncbi:hypothetical protein V2H45_11370 [Tumidithrix elongata RA019]|uniref:Uncharacterized protein n=1 Tax=Tumidithrix elongata BACA0141 TaxID=2716417 RepID=A0AAW9PSL2_9CYAN|nr:hypothetical protein [Tumidithrix elongata RA019]